MDVVRKMVVQCKNAVKMALADLKNVKGPMQGRESAGAAGEGHAGDMAEGVGFEYETRERAQALEQPRVD